MCEHYVHAWLCMCRCVNAYTKTHLWRSENNFVEQIFSFLLYVDSRHWTQVIRLARQGLLLQSPSLWTLLSAFICLCCFCNVNRVPRVIGFLHTPFALELLPMLFLHPSVHTSVLKDHRFNVYKPSSEKTNHYCWCFVTYSHTKWLYIS